MKGTRNSQAQMDAARAIQARLTYLIEDLGLAHWTCRDPIYFVQRRTKRVVAVRTIDGILLVRGRISA